MDLSSLLTSRTAAIIGLVCIALSALAALWAMVKLSYQRALGKPMPRNALTATLDVLAELAVNVVGAVSRGLKLGTGEGLFRSTLPLTPAEMGIALPAEKTGAIVVSETRPVAHPTPADGVAFDAQRVALGAVTVDPAKGDGQRGSVDLPGLLTFVVGVLLAGALCVGCPRNPPVSGCQPEAQTCINDRPHVCSASQRWHVAGDRTCSSIGGQCTVLGGRAYCAPVADAGSPDASEGGL
jgi:hypothetical protein